MKRLLLSLLLLAGSLSAYQAKNVVILVIDGPRQSEMWATTHTAHIPHMAQTLAPQGALLAGFRNNGPTYTNAGHAALCTGHYEELENTQGTQLPSRPGIFQAFLAKSRLPKEKAWVITSKGKLSILANTQNKAWHGRYQPSQWCGVNGSGSGYGKDADTMAAVKRILAEQQPRLVLVNLREPDSSGHKNDWPGYLQGLQDSDAHAADLWQTLQADAFYKDRTALFITHDHGRHLDGIANGFIDHGDGCEGCRHIALLALGPDFKKGLRLETGGEQIDVPVTVAEILGFKLPGLKGRVLKEIFQ